MKIILDKDKHLGRKAYRPACERSRALLRLMKTHRGDRKLYMQEDYETLKKIGFTVIIRTLKVVDE